MRPVAALFLPLLVSSCSPSSGGPSPSPFPPDPEITQVSPTTFDRFGGADFEVIGARFQKDAVVRMGSDLADNQVNHSRQRLTATAPLVHWPSTSSSISVENPGAESSDHAWIRLIGRAIHRSPWPLASIHGADCTDDCRFLVWEDGPVTDRDVWFLRSEDEGVTWSRPQKLSRFGRPSRGPLLRRVDEDLYVLWEQDYLDGEEVRRWLYFTRSSDHGVTFQPAVPVDRSDETDGCDAQLAFRDDGTGLLVYQAGAQVRCRTFNGSSFGPPVIVDQGSSAAVTCVGTSFHLLYLSLDRQDLLGASSYDNGATWSRLVVVDNARDLADPALSVGTRYYEGGSSSAILVLAWADRDTVRLASCHRFVLEEGETFEFEAEASLEGYPPGGPLSIREEHSAGSRWRLIMESEGRTVVVDFDVIPRPTYFKGPVWHPSVYGSVLFPAEERQQSIPFFVDDYLPYCGWSCVDPETGLSLIELF